MPQVSLSELVTGVCSGEHLISFPTDTVPALAVRPDHSELIFAAKQRNLNKPLILMGANPQDLWPFVSGSSRELELWQQTAAQYWPGALTLVLPANQDIPTQINPHDPSTIGIRVPQSAIARMILAQTGPLATTSANRSGEPPCQTLAEVEQQFPNVLTLLPTELEQTEQTDPTSGIPSTVIKWSSQNWEILRQGAVPFRI
jgi:L-threonylcarbamoyladenylate synthase